MVCGVILLLNFQFLNSHVQSLKGIQNLTVSDFPSPFDVSRGGEFKEIQAAHCLQLGNQMLGLHSSSLGSIFFILFLSLFYHTF